MIAEVRADARDVLKVVRPLDQEIACNGATAELFTKLTRIRGAIAG